jgi:hypothetical protein
MKVFLFFLAPLLIAGCSVVRQDRFSVDQKYAHLKKIPKVSNTQPSVTSALIQNKISDKEVMPLISDRNISNSRIINPPQKTFFETKVSAVIQLKKIIAKEKHAFCNIPVIKTKNIISKSNTLSASGHASVNRWVDLIRIILLLAIAFGIYSLWGWGGLIITIAIIVVSALLSFLLIVMLFKGMSGG